MASASNFSPIPQTTSAVNIQIFNPTVEASANASRAESAASSNQTFQASTSTPHQDQFVPQSASASGSNSSNTSQSTALSTASAMTSSNAVSSVSPVAAAAAAAPGAIAPINTVVSAPVPSSSEALVPTAPNAPLLSNIPEYPSFNVKQQLENAYLQAIQARNEAEQYRTAYLGLANQFNNLAYQQQMLSNLQLTQQQAINEQQAATAQTSAQLSAQATATAQAQMQAAEQAQLAAQQAQMAAQASAQYAAQSAVQATTNAAPNVSAQASVSQQVNPFEQAAAQQPAFQEPFQQPMMPQQAPQQLPVQPSPEGFPSPEQMQTQPGPFPPSQQPPAAPPSAEAYPPMQAPMPGPSAVPPTSMPMEQLSIDELNQRIARMAPFTEQDVVNAIEEVAIRGNGNDDTYQLLESWAIQAPPAGKPVEEVNDHNYIRSAALWTLGMLMNATPNTAASPQIQGRSNSVLSTIEEIVKNKSEDPYVQVAAIQALRVYNKPFDERVKGILKAAAKSKHPEVKQQAKKAQNGEPIQPATEPQSNAIPEQGMPNSMPAMPGASADALMGPATQLPNFYNPAGNLPNTWMNQPTAPAIPGASADPLMGPATQLPNFYNPAGNLPNTWMNQPTAPAMPGTNPAEMAPPSNEELAQLMALLGNAAASGSQPGLQASGPQPGPQPGGHDALQAQGAMPVATGNPWAKA